MGFFSFFTCFLVHSNFLISPADVNFALELSDLRHRHGFRIILVHKNQASEALLHHAHELICFEEFISDLPPRLPLKMPVRFLILTATDTSKCQLPFLFFSNLEGEQAEIMCLSIKKHIHLLHS